LLVSEKKLLKMQIALVADDDADSVVDNNSITLLNYLQSAIITIIIYHVLMIIK
jgi:hypothetical protein